MSNQISSELIDQLIEYAEDNREHVAYLLNTVPEFVAEQAIGYIPPETDIIHAGQQLPTDSVVYIGFDADGDAFALECFPVDTNLEVVSIGDMKSWAAIPRSTVDPELIEDLKLSSYHVATDSVECAVVLAYHGIAATYTKELEPLCEVTHISFGYLSPDKELNAAIAINPSAAIVEKWVDNLSLTRYHSATELVNSGGGIVALAESLRYAEPAMHRLADMVSTAPNGERRTLAIQLIEAFNRLDHFDQIMEAGRLQFRSGIKSREWLSIQEVYVADEIDRPPPRVWTHSEILSTEFEKPKWFIDELIVDGSFGIISGKAKHGKSFLALQMATAVGEGGQFMGRGCTKAKSLYCALEDTPDSLQSRIQAQATGHDVETHYQFEIENLTGTGLKKLSEKIESDGYGFVIIDTLTSATNRLDQMDALQISTTFKAIRAITRKTGCTIVIIDHQTKGSKEGMDVSDTHFGSMQKGALADVQMSFVANKAEGTAILSANGKRIAEYKLALKWDVNHLSWIYLGDADEVVTTQLQEEILSTLEDLGDDATNAQIADAMCKDRSQVNKQLKNMAEKGILDRSPGHGRSITYSIPVRNNDHQQ